MLVLAARFVLITGLAVDGAGIVYVADDNCIRKITPTGLVSTIAGVIGLSGSTDGSGSSARFNMPGGVAVDANGMVYVADSNNNTIRSITPAGVVSTLAGTAGSSGSTDGTGAAARFNSPAGVAVDSAGFVYVADKTNQTIRKITPGGTVSTLAGTAGSSGYVNATGAAARFGNPSGVAVDSSGNVYVADTQNSGIRMITSAGVVSALFVYSTSGGPSYLAADAGGNIYFTNGSYTSNLIRKITFTGAVSIVAPILGGPGFVNGTGAAARFNTPNGVATDASGNVYVADTLNYVIRKVTPAGTASTFASVASSAYGVAVDSNGNVYVADTFNQTIDKITPGGVVSTLAGTAATSGSANGTGAAARFKNPYGVAVDGSGNVYVADTTNDTIRKITPAGVVTTLAGTAGSSGSTDGTGAAARFNQPEGVAVNSAGTIIYVADTGNDTIRKITSAGVVTTLAGSPGNSGTQDGTGAAAQFYSPVGIAVDGSGTLFVADYEYGSVRKITSAGVVTTVGGNGGITANGFQNPTGIAVDSNGLIYLGDTGDEEIKVGKPTLADGAIIDAASGNVGTLRQLDTAPQTATAWTWQLLRQPFNSTVALSSTSIRNPTFTPDVPDGFVFQLTATTATGASVSTVTLTGTGSPIPVLSALSPTSATTGGAAYTLTLQGDRFVAGSVVKWPGQADLTPVTQSLNQLTVQVPASYIAAAGSPSISVFNPTPGGGASAYQTVVISTSPNIDNPSAATFKAGTASSFMVSATGSPALAITQTGTLPAGVTFVDNGNGTATLGGTPAAGSGGVYALVITAANSVGPNAVQNFTLTVNETPAITSPPYATFTYNVPGTFTVTTLGYPKPALRIGSAVLPSGVSFFDNGDGTGTLTGTPDSELGGVFAFTIAAGNSAGASPGQNFTLQVNHGSVESAPFLNGGSITLLPNGKVLAANVNNDVTTAIYDPTTNTMTAGANMNIYRISFSAILLATRKVLVVGGWQDSSNTEQTVCDLYDPNANSWSPGGTMANGRISPAATLLNSGKVLVIGGYKQSTGTFFTAAELYNPALNTWSSAGTLTTGRYNATSTLLPSGKVLVAGGYNGTSYLKTTDIYNPATNSFTAGPAMANARDGYSAILLPSGKVFVVGGYNGTAYVAATELYDPVANTWSATTPAIPMAGNTSATLLPNGTVWVNVNASSTFATYIYDPVGNAWTTLPTAPIATSSVTYLSSGKLLMMGTTTDGNYTPIAGIYDPASAGAFTATGALSAARAGQTSTLLASGKILATGGFNGSYLSSAELYDQTAAAWTSTGSMSAARSAHTATLLGSGKMLVAGGYNGAYLNSAELCDATGATWSPTGALATARSGHTATLLSNGNVLVAGGYNGAYLSSAELYNPALGTWSSAGSMSSARSNHTATLLPGGKIMVAGGANSGGATTGAELYDPVTNSWSPAYSLANARKFHSATLQPNGQVLVVGGSNGAAVASTELYDPVANLWSSAGFLNVARELHSATLLNGRVLVAGGDNGSAALNSGELYDPISNSWTLTGNLKAARTNGAAMLLLNGSVLIAGMAAAAARRSQAPSFSPTRWAIRALTSR